MDASTILNSRFAELGFSDDFCRKSKSLGFDTIEDVINTAPGALVKKNGFSYVWLAELTTYLTRNGLLGKLQPIPGRNCD